MALLLEENEQVTVPVSGKRALKLDANGNPLLVESTGAEALLTSGWQLVERKVITVDAQSYTFENLNGDLDECYKILAAVKGGVGSASGLLSVRPNGATAADDGSGMGSDGGDPPFGDGRAEMTLGYAPAAGRLSLQEGTFWAKTGSDRAMTSMVSFPAANRGAFFGSRWTDTSTVVESLMVFSSDAAGLGIGTVLMLSKLVIPG